MRKLKCILIGILSLGVVIPVPVLGSWVQADRATSDIELRRITNDGSMAFLQAAINVQQSIRLLDSGKIMEAKSNGLGTIGDFKMASGKFAEAIDRVKKSPNLQKELNDFLSKVKYPEKATQLGIPPSSPLWVTLERIAKEQGAIGLFGEAANRARSKSDLAASFFGKVGTEKHSSIEGAKLLVQIGADLVFGGYVSAIFTKE